jgi:hypothetical protein
MNTVIFTGWKTGLKKISLTHLLKEKCNLSFTHAKLFVDAIVKDITIEVECSTKEKMNSLIKEATKLGAICKASDNKLTKA